MRFSARVSYGLRAAVFLAERYRQGAVLGREISEAEDLPPAYLEQIMALLRRSDLIGGKRGARGGYVLTRPPEDITATELITALEGPIQLSECPDGPSCCGSPDTCVVNGLYRAAEMALLEVLDNRRLSDLLEERVLLRSDAHVYQI